METQNNESTEVTKQKIHVIADKLIPSVTYSWNKKINRRTENNNTTVKFTPVLLQKIQEKQASLTSARSVKQWICHKLDITWCDSFEKYDLLEVRPTAVSDKTKVEESELVVKYRNHLESAIAKSGKPITSEKILANIESSQYTKEQKEELKTVFIDSHKKATTKEVEDFVPF